MILTIKTERFKKDAYNLRLFCCRLLLMYGYGPEDMTGKYLFQQYGLRDLSVNAKVACRMAMV